MVLGSLVLSTARRGARPWPSTHASRDSLHPFADHRLAEGKGLSLIGQRQEAKLFALAAEITYDKMTDAQDSSGTQTRDELRPLRHGVSVQNGSLLRNMGYACPSAERLRRACVFSGGTQSCVARSSTLCLCWRDRLGLLAESRIGDLYDAVRVLWDHQRRPDRDAYRAPAVAPLAPANAVRLELFQWTISWLSLRVLSSAIASPIWSPGCVANPFRH